MSHPAGKDAFLLAESHLFNSLDAKEEIILDFAEVKVLTPSWAEEFIYGFKDLHKIVYNKVRNLGQKKAIENSKMLVTTTNKKGKDNGQEERYYIF